MAGAHDEDSGAAGGCGSQPYAELLRRAHDASIEYLNEVDQRRVSPSAAALRDLERLGGALPKRGADPEMVIEELVRYGAPATMAQMGGRYFGFVNGGALPVGLAARWLADTWDQNAAHFVMSPIAAQVESVCERWLAELLGLPEGCAAGFVTGTMMANFAGLAAGRAELYRRQGVDVRTEGLYGLEPLRVIVGAAAHAAIAKALSLLGMGSANIEVVPTDEQGALDLAAVPTLDDRCLVALQAGNVNSGAFDPIGAVCERAREAGAWVHVDGAFGLWARASRRFDRHTEGWELADSWALDAHKTLNTPYDCGIALCRDRDAYTRAFEASATYFQWGAEREGMRYTPSMSKRARGVELWAILRALGREGVAALVEQLHDRALLFAELLQAEGFDVVNDVVFNQVLVACTDDALTRATLARVQESGECWCGGSEFSVDGAKRAVIRLSVCSWRTTEDDVRRTVRALAAARAEADQALGQSQAKNPAVTRP